MDVDEVMGDTLGHQIEWLRKQRGCSLKKQDLRGKKPHDLVAEEHVAALEAEMQAGEFFSGIPVMPGCQEVVALLTERYEIYVTTAAMDYPRSCNAKFDWLQEHFPTIAKDCYVFCGDKAIVQADFLIDDSERHFKNFRGTGILFDSPHNADVQGYERVSSWADVAARFVTG